MRVRVWDLPTRVFHWCTALCFAGLLVSGEVAGQAMVWHFRLGYALLALVLFRILWGIAGGYWSRFSSFVTGPSTLWRYLRRPESGSTTVGHNPLGALSVVALLLGLTLQIASGLISDDEVFTSGPLVAKVAPLWVQKATFYHTEIGKVLLILLTLLHVCAIVWYRVKKKRNLVAAMVGGDQEVIEPTIASRDDARSRALAALLLALCGLAVATLLWWAQLPT